MNSLHFKTEITNNLFWNFIYILNLCNLTGFIGLVVRVFANGPGDQGSILDRVIPKTQKMVPHYKIWIKGKVKQSREWSSTLLLHLGAVAIEKGAFRSPLTMVTNFTYLFMYSVE